MKPRNLSRARNAKMQKKKKSKKCQSVQKSINLVTLFLHCLLTHFAFLTFTLIAHNSIALPALACDQFFLYKFILSMFRTNKSYNIKILQ